MSQPVAEKISQLRSLVRLLVESSEVVIKEWEAEAAQASEPNNTPDVPSPALYEARRVIIGACGMCIDLVQDPLLRLGEVVSSYFAAKCLNIAVQARVADIVAEADPQRGISVEDIGRRTGINGRKLAQLLRCLSTIHIFSEIKDGYFVNTRTSEYMVANDSIQGGAVTEKLPAVLFDPVKTHSRSPRESAFQEAYGTNSTLWEYLEEPVEQPDGTMGPRPAFNTWIGGMMAAGRAESSATYVDYPWHTLGSRTVIDVGGGLGGMSLELAKRYPDLKFVVQDREAVIEKAELIWKQELPEALEAERVKFMRHDFFTQQPVKEADVFILRHILHDWPDDECVTILRHLRDAMRRDSRLLVADKVMQTTAGSPLLKSAPSPLPANYGYAHHMGNILAIGMLALFNGVERTPEEFSALAENAGLRVVKIWECRGLAYVTEMRRNDYDG
ncbi:hypothetical protein POSPLADRAFT_1043216 [Postia placenta MAD-698-R-SB12]|uniref:Uncharacterized protein n=1 Tax=Postia placenta MAD-698-R-SB12 TaxID=670580 RepID=A0A1X6NHG5_9APHY|nr:hypothetical protein POSPLADRAFT_1043216 [Postia placenta MAD-698-R-SB12]OSX68054.1 hypothetical protein POSPLADRAFT_1043216 [Postia placenta MAD-698-R-SB12]